MSEIITMMDWRANHPGNLQYQSDIYYTKLSNKIIKIIKKSPLYSYFPHSSAIIAASMTITRWFEDICTGLGFWHTVVEECQRRYGKPVPFYDTRLYIEDEPNVQDIQLLLWDLLSLLYDDDLINPLNPDILMTALDIMELLDKEWETADSTEELLEYFSDPLIGIDYWVTRDKMEWISLYSYINLSGIYLYLKEEKRVSQQFKQDEYHDGIMYYYKWGHIISDRHNILSFTSDEWLSSICKKKMDINTDLFQQRIYTIARTSPTAIVLEDAVNGKHVDVDPESIDQSWLESDKCRPGESVCCSLVRINGTYNLCGMMLSGSDKEFSESINNQNYNHDKMKENSPVLIERFYKFSKGKKIVFLDGEKQINNFFKQMDFRPDDPEVIKLKDSLEKQNAKLQVAAIPSPGFGINFITQHIPALKSADNKLYNEEYSLKHAHTLVCNPNMTSYHGTLVLVREGMLADASFEDNINDKESKQAFQQNAEFLVDYYHSNHE